MTGQRDSAVDLQLRWLGWAREDLVAADHVATDLEVVPRAGCVFAHQAAEKALKGLLVDQGIDPPKVHDLVRLTRMLPVDLQDRLLPLDLVDLTRWAIEGRYPDDFEAATSADEAKAISVARNVLAVAADVLQPPPNS